MSKKAIESKWVLSNKKELSGIIIKHYEKTRFRINYYLEKSYYNEDKKSYILLKKDMKTKQIGSKTVYDLEMLLPKSLLYEDDNSFILLEDDLNILWNYLEETYKVSIFDHYNINNYEKLILELYNKKIINISDFFELFALKNYIHVSETDFNIKTDNLITILNLMCILQKFTNHNNTIKRVIKSIDFDVENKNIFKSIKSLIITSDAQYVTTNEDKDNFKKIKQIRDLLTHFNEYKFKATDENSRIVIEHKVEKNKILIYYTKTNIKNKLFKINIELKLFKNLLEKILKDFYNLKININ